MIVTPAARPRRSRPRPQPRQFRSSSAPARTRSNLGLVTSLNRPGGNVTGVSIMNQELGPKRLGLLHELMPAATRFAVLSIRADPSIEAYVTDVRAAARPSGGRSKILTAKHESRDRREPLRASYKSGSEALLVSPGPPFCQTVASSSLRLAARHGVPAIYPDAPVRRSRRADELRIEHDRSSIAKPASTPAASSRARSPPTCRCCRRPSSSSSSISRPPRRSASTCRRPCSPAPTR